MPDLPPLKSWGQREALEMIVMRGLESVTRSLRSGDGFDLSTLRPLAARCRALSDAFDARMREQADVIEDDQ